MQCIHKKNGDKILVGFISIFPTDGEERTDLSPWYATMYVKEKCRWRCYSRIIKRIIKNHNKEKSDISGCKERFDFTFIKYVATYNRKKRPKVIEFLKDISDEKLLVFRKQKDLNKWLFCIRAKEPYKRLYNFVGGKVEEGENNYEAAYRELFEETGTSKNDIELDHFMDLNYFKYENNLQVYYGILKHNVDLIEEKNKLEWVELDEGLLNNDKFAGNYNIPHIIRQIKVYLKNGTGLGRY